MSDAADSARQSVAAVLAEFDSRKDKLDRFCIKTKELIEECLNEAQVRFQSVQARVKERDKLRTKYLNPHKAYRCLDDITDLAGLRVITYYSDEVDAAAEVIRREFDIDEHNSVDKRSKEPDKFGYYAVHYVCSHSPQRLGNTEYKKFSGVTCEIQVASILSHAWAEIEHDWYDLGEAYPPEVKRRFNRMSALLEIAESEFRDLRKARADHEQSVKVRVEAEVPETPLDEISLRAFIDQDPLVQLIDKELVAQLEIEAGASFVSKPYDLVTQAGFQTIPELREALETHQANVIRFAKSLSMQLQEPVPLEESVVLLGLMLTALKSGPEFDEGYFRAFGLRAPAGLSELFARAANAAVANDPEQDPMGN